ncbi:DUF3347 domain-containing protein [Sediminicola luteus]|uniref:DUF3347 domain-containing protein n=1 Tax=Sediminicola luteus TaxID=319238 RepID=A0ABV2TU97_9FLAO
MKSIKIISLVLMALSITSSYAQSKNQKSENVKILGNCNMCKSTIEKAGTIDNEAKVDWDKDTKIATLTYDSLKTSKDDILKRIALVGYDNESFLAPEDTYLNLPSCCQYDRAEQISANIDESKSDMAFMDHSKHSNKMIEVQETNPLSGVYDSYFAIKDALVKTDGVLASTNAKMLLKTINEVKMDQLSMDVHMVWMKVLKNLKEDAATIADTKVIGKQRGHFDSLSKNIYEIMKVSKQESPTYYQFCPMANNGKGANWLSKEETIKNPYYGSQMMSCGKTVETIEE